MPERSDAELVTCFRAGDDRALEALFERFESPLYCFLLGMLRDPHQAEDALQETFVRALEHLDGVDPDHLRGWLFTVAYHQALLVRRKAATRRQRHGAEGNLQAAGARADHLPGPLERAAREDDVRRLRELLEQLPAPQREVIHRRVYGGQKFREIAEDMNCPLNTALARMHEGLKRLRLLWGESHV